MKKDSKQRLFEVMGRLDKTFKPKLNEYHDGDPEGYQEPYHSFNPEEHPKYSTHEYPSSNREGFTNNIPNKKIEDFFNYNLRDSQAFQGMEDISFNVMKDEVFSAMKSSGVSNLDDLQDIFNNLNEMNIQEQQTRPLYEIAREIRQDWGGKIYFGAVPYLQAMATLNSIEDNYGMDSGKSIVLYFLANAQTWRGETAKRVKAELKSMAGLKENVELNEDSVVNVGDVLMYDDGLYFKIIEINNGVAVVFDGFKTKGKIEVDKLIKGNGNGLKILKDADGRIFKSLIQKSKRHIKKFGTDSDNEDGMYESLYDNYGQGDNRDEDSDKSDGIYHSIFDIENDIGPRDFVETLTAVIDYARKSQSSTHHIVGATYRNLINRAKK